VRHPHLVVATKTTVRITCTCTLSICKHLDARLVDYASSPSAAVADTGDAEAEWLQHRMMSTVECYTHPYHLSSFSTTTK